MAKKEVLTTIRLQIRGGSANPSPPIGPALGSRNVNIMDFCSQFNHQTQGRYDETLPVVITIYTDKTFTFVVKQPTITSLLKKAAQVQSGLGEPNTKKVGSITKRQLEQIATTKMPDLGAKTLQAAMRTIEGTAKGMGIEIVD